MITPVDTHFYAWAAGNFDSRGSIFIGQKGRIRLRITFPREYLAQFCKAVWGGSVYESHCFAWGASYVWEATSRKALPGVLQTLARYSRGQQAMLRVAYLCLEGVFSSDEARDALRALYKEYYNKGPDNDSKTVAQETSEQS